MRKLEDLVGKTFNRLTVVGYKKSYGGRTTWICDCECGGKTTAFGYQLKSGHKKSCGCLFKESIFIANSHDLKDKKFGELTAVKVDGRKCGNIVWLCHCSCGNTHRVYATHLVSGKIFHCGCLAEKKELRSLEGRKFGSWTILSNTYTENGEHACLCQCTCGEQKIIKRKIITSGKTPLCNQCSKKKIPTGTDHFNWKGGRNYNGGGYVLIKMRGHPNADKKGYVFEHTYVMSNYLGRPLVKGEIIHHRNGIRDDNRIENLELWIRTHPIGQRVSDLIDFSIYILSNYAPRYLSQNANNTDDSGSKK